MTDSIPIYEEGEKVIRDHYQKLDTFLYRCREQGIKLKLRLRDRPYIGHVLTSKGPSESTGYHRFWNSKECRRCIEIIGTCELSAKFIDNVSVMSDPICSLIYQNIDWKWTYEHEEAFNKLKEAISQAPVLKYFDSKEVRVWYIEHCTWRNPFTVRSICRLCQQSIDPKRTTICSDWKETPGCGRWNEM